MGLTGRWARRCAAHPKRTLGAWLAAMVAGIVIAGALLSSALSTTSDFTRAPESQRATDLIKDRLGSKEPIRDVVIVRSASATVSDPAFRTFVEGVHRRLVALGADTLRAAPSYYTSHDASLVSADRHA